MTRPSFHVTIPAKFNSKDTYGDIVVETPGECPDGREAYEVTEGVTRRKPSGWLDPTPYTFLYRRLERATGRTRIVIDPLVPLLAECDGCVGGGSFNSVDHFNSLVTDYEIIETVGDLEQRSLIAARMKIKQARVNLGVAFAERNATARLLGDTATRLASSVRFLRVGNVRGAMAALGLSSASGRPSGSNWPQKWLELQYGWKPLLSDVYGACEALSKLPRETFRVTAKDTKKEEWTRSTEWSDTSSGKGVARVSRSVYTRIDAIPDNDAIISLASLGITNPLLVAWELVPYSFVVDWALPIGGWLESLDALLGYKEISYSQSTLCKGKWEERGTTQMVGAFLVDNQYYGTKKLVSLRRSASTAVPQAIFPRFKDPRSLGHMANGLSLLASAFGRSR